MKKKNKNKARKSITAVGAVVAAGLTPGIVTGTPAPQVPAAPAPDIELTAADAVSINGDVFDFDELFAMTQVKRDKDQMKVVYGPRQPKVYGPVPPKKDKDKDKKKDKDKDKKKKEDKDQQIREQEIADSLMQEQMKKEEENRLARERWRRDSIERAIAQNHKLVYGPPPPPYAFSSPEELRIKASIDKENAQRIVEHEFSVFVQQNFDIDFVSMDANIVRELKLNSKQRKALIEMVEDRFNVQVTDEMMKKLGSLRRVANFIVEVITPINKKD